MTITDLSKSRYLRGAVFLVALLALSSVVPAAKLKPATVKAFEQYEKLTEKRIAAELDSGKGFLIQDFLPPSDQKLCRQTIQSGGVHVQKMKTKTDEDKNIKVPSGMIHHWMGSVNIPKARLADVLAWVQNYDKHEDYFPEVERSRLLSGKENIFEIFLRLKRKKFVTAHYNTDHRVVYRHHDACHVSSASYATRIAQVAEAGKPEEKEKPIGNDSGYLWRLNSYWRFMQKDGGVVVECESISLSRSIPPVISVLIKGYVKATAKESLFNTLVSIRDGYHNPEKTKPPEDEF
ncbi:hypothetical protein ACFLU6_04440 [Acidobacteriota bacterium]